MPEADDYPSFFSKAHVVESHDVCAWIVSFDSLAMFPRPDTSVDFGGRARA